ncbi:serine hydroxymethyltransferase, partial [Candidatus Pacearchaeota archaeon]|nr:serine hydroxymethyltransferase [Candidatus Pacearchaeota archaeon]
KDYANQIVSNAKALGQALYERGLKVLAEHKGFTESHVILIDITEHNDGGTLEEQLEKANIILNRNLLPWDIREGRHFMHPGGIRLGTSEVTRLGMREKDMVEIADFIRRVILDKESPEKVRKDVAEFRKDFQNIHYCFEKESEAHSYMKITGR